MAPCPRRQRADGRAAERVILDVLGTLVAHGHLGHRNKVMK
jgi:hypothetical protein